LASDECLELKARLEVLRSVTVHGSGAAAARGAGAGGGAESPQLASARSRISDLQALVQAQKGSLEQSAQELAALRKDGARLAGMEARVGVLERANSDLVDLNRRLEHQQEARAARDAQPGAAPVDGSDAAQFAHGSEAGAAAGTGSVSQTLVRVQDALRRAPAAAIDTGALDGGGDSAKDILVAVSLAHQQVVQQFEAFKAAVARHVQDFREGIFGLLGWKVDMRLERGALRWTLRSRYNEGQELAFQLKAPEGSQPAEFELLKTPWGEELRADHQATACLEVYNSVPCFLAHVTGKLLAQEAEALTD